MTSATGLTHGTGLRIVFDDRSRDYPIRILLDPTAAPVSKRWPCYTRLDQDGVGACVGFAWSNELAAEPVSVKGVDNDLGFRIYREAQKVDEWPGEAYEGTSVLAGAKIVQQMGYMSEYRWAFGVQDVVDTLSQHGPVVFGVPWYGSMYTPQPDGRLTISGVASGGHAIIGDELDVPRGRIWLLNNWTKGWGIDGRAWMPIEDWDKLLRQGGQACVPVKREDPAPAPPPSPAPVDWTKVTDADFDAEFNRRYGYFKDMDIGFTGSERRWFGKFV